MGRSYKVKAGRTGSCGSTWCSGPRGQGRGLCCSSSSRRGPADGPQCGGHGVTRPRCPPPPDAACVAPGSRGCDRCREATGRETSRFSAEAAFSSRPRSPLCLTVSHTAGPSARPVPALPCPSGRCQPCPRALDPCRSGADRDLRGRPCSPPPRPPRAETRVFPGRRLRLRETNACCSPCSLLCPYSAMATYSATCANTSPAQGIHMANSIANLRLKAKEYSLQRNQVPTVN